MYKKFWILIQETDEHGHHAAYIRPVTSSDNLVSIYPVTLPPTFTARRKNRIRFAEC